MPGVCESVVTVAVADAPCHVARMIWPPAWSFQVTYASARESGAHTGWYSPTSFDDTRAGRPLGRSITYTRSRATNASFRPSGDCAMSRTWWALNVAAVST